jgi:hypothetical protein
MPLSPGGGYEAALRECQGVFDGRLVSSFNDATIHANLALQSPTSSLSVLPLRFAVIFMVNSTTC